MPPIPHSVTAALHTCAGALLALAVALAGALLCRGKARRRFLPAIGAVAAGAGWAMAVPAASLWRTGSAPGGGPGLLLLPAATGGVLVLLASWWGARAARWAGVAAIVVSGWWLAGSPAGRAEFWRVWAAVAVLGWLLAKGVRGEPYRGLAACVALWAGLACLGSVPGWAVTSSVAVAAWVGLLPAGGGAFVPAGVMAALIGAADLGAGRLARGGMNAIDVACLAACGAPFLAGAVAPRTKRLGAFGPVLAGVAAGLLGAGVAWVAQRGMRS